MAVNVATDESQRSIFVGYRRADTGDAAGRIAEYLQRGFGKTAVFKDVNAMPPGIDFRGYVASYIQSVDTFLALIGPRWCEAERGTLSRLWDHDDLVRTEIELALGAEHILVVPVLVSGAKLPRAEDLPLSIRDLVKLQTSEVRQDPDFVKDMHRLIQDLRAPRRKPQIKSARRVAGKRIGVVGIGGAGINAINTMIDARLEGVEFCALNTDAQSLAQSRAPTKLRIGAKITEGLGAGGRPEIGARAALESLGDIAKTISGMKVVFLAAGLGKGTGTGALPVIARLAREQGAAVIAAVSLPFEFEGARRMKAAKKALAGLRDNVEALIAVPNQKLFLHADKDTPFAEAVKIADAELYTIVRSVLDVAVVPGLVSVSVDELIETLRGFGIAKVGVGRASTRKEYNAAVNAALTFAPLYEPGLERATRAIVNVHGGKGLTLAYLDSIAAGVRARLRPGGQVLLGSSYHSALGESIEISVWANGAADISEEAMDETPPSGRASQAVE